MYSAASCARVRARLFWRRRLVSWVYESGLANFCQRLFSVLADGPRVGAAVLGADDPPSLCFGVAGWPAVAEVEAAAGGNAPNNGEWDGET